MDHPEVELLDVPVSGPGKIRDAQGDMVASHRREG
jgi:hypothetical protein